MSLFVTKIQIFPYISVEILRTLVLFPRNIHLLVTITLRSFSYGQDDDDENTKDYSSISIHWVKSLGNRYIVCRGKPRPSRESAERRRP